MLNKILGGIENLLENKRKNDDWKTIEFPFTIHLKINSKEQQFEHIKSELLELEKAMNSNNIDEIAAETVELMCSCFTLLGIIRKKYDYYERELVIKYMKKGYYDHEMPKNELEAIIETFEAMKKLAKLEKKKSKKEHKIEAVKINHSNADSLEEMVLEEIIQRFIKEYKGNIHDLPEAVAGHFSKLGIEGVKIVQNLDEKKGMGIIHLEIDRTKSKITH